mmetsp:Transcript_16583/g.38249  ORF Transcript_16583/g.38249 Transcript_16583/m.38249 type:complete len:687 (-) Transcript_16583:540-2600(-)
MLVRGSPRHLARRRDAPLPPHGRGVPHPPAQHSVDGERLRPRRDRDAHLVGAVVVGGVQGKPAHPPNREDGRRRLREPRDKEGRGVLPHDKAHARRRRRDRGEHRRAVEVVVPRFEAHGPVRLPPARRPRHLELRRGHRPQRAEPHPLRGPPRREPHQRAVAVGAVAGRAAGPKGPLRVLTKGCQANLESCVGGHTARVQHPPQVRRQGRPRAVDRRALPGHEHVAHDPQRGHKLVARKRAPHQPPRTQRVEALGVGFHVHHVDHKVDRHPPRRPPARYVHSDLVQARPLFRQQRHPPVRVYPFHRPHRRLPKHDPAAVRLRRDDRLRRRRPEQRPERPPGGVQGVDPRDGASLLPLASHSEVPQRHQHVARRVRRHRHHALCRRLPVSRRPDPRQHGPRDLRGRAHPVPEAPLGQSGFGVGARVTLWAVGPKQQGSVRREPDTVHRAAHALRHPQQHAVEVDRVLQAGRPPCTGRAPRRGGRTHHREVDPLSGHRARHPRVVGPEHLAHLSAGRAHVEGRMGGAEVGVRRLVHLVPHGDCCAVDPDRQHRHLAPPDPLRSRERARAPDVLTRRQHVPSLVVGDAHPPLHRQAGNRGVLREQSVQARPRRARVGAVRPRRVHGRDRRQRHRQAARRVEGAHVHRPADNGGLSEGPVDAGRVVSRDVQGRAGHRHRVVRHRDHRGDG